MRDNAAARNLLTRPQLLDESIYIYYIVHTVMTVSVCPIALKIFDVQTRF